jgi:hypothetical protein
MSATVVKTAHFLGKRTAWVHPTYGVRKVRSYVGNRAQIMAITGCVEEGGWGPKQWVVLKLHSCASWKHPHPELTRASTELYLNREDAEQVLVALMSAISEYDRREAEGGPA